MKNKLTSLLYILFFILPIIVLILYSISERWPFPALFPEKFGPRSLQFLYNNYENIFKGLITSFTYSILTVILTFIISVLPASVFARNNFKGKAFLEALCLAPVLVPSITFAMGIHYFFIIAGLSDTIWGVILVLTIYSYPYMLRALINGFGIYGREYDLTAKNLGANLFTRLIKIQIPLLLPSIISGSTVVFLVAFSEYFLVFLIGGGSVSSYSGLLFPYLNSSDLAISSTLSLIFLLIPITLFLIIDKSLMKYYRKRKII